MCSAWSDNLSPGAVNYEWIIHEVYAYSYRVYINIISFSQGNRVFWIVYMLYEINCFLQNFPSCQTRIHSVNNNNNNIIIMSCLFLHVVNDDVDVYMRLTTMSMFTWVDIDDVYVGWCVDVYAGLITMSTFAGGW